MQKHAEINLENNIFYLSGDLNFYNVMPLYQQSILYFRKLSLNELSMLQFDFSKLQSSDSVGIALIIEWIKYANQNKLSIRFFHFPKNLLAIAKAARIDSFIHKN